MATEALFAAFQGQQEQATEPVNIRVRDGVVPDGNSPFFLTAYRNGKKAGWARFEPNFRGNDMVLTNIEVEPEYRRQGIATQLWEHVKTLGFEPVHSQLRYPDGDAFAKAVGGPMPPNLLPTRDSRDPEVVESANKEYWAWLKTRGPVRSRFRKTADTPTV